MPKSPWYFFYKIIKLNFKAFKIYFKTIIEWRSRMVKRIVVAITGASGVIYGIKMLECLKDKDLETHLILSPTGEKIIHLETQYDVEYVRSLADYSHHSDELTSPLASGSFLIDSMVIIPCTIKTLSGIVNSYNNNLIIRAADVTLKEKRKLVLVVRETPLHLGHLKLMCRAAELGAYIFPPVPAFYHKPNSIDNIVEHTVGKIFDYLGIDHDLFKRWTGGPS